MSTSRNGVLPAILAGLALVGSVHALAQGRLLRPRSPGTPGFSRVLQTPVSTGREETRSVAFVPTPGPGSSPGWVGAGFRQLGGVPQFAVNVSQPNDAGLNLILVPGEVSGPGAALSVAADQAGNLYAAGFLQTVTGGADFAVASVDSSGVLRWTRTLPGQLNSQETAVHLTLDPLGNVLVIGTIFDPDSSFDVRVAKLNPVNGAVAWVRTFSGFGEGDQGARVAIAPTTTAGQPDVYVAGDFRVGFEVRTRVFKLTGAQGNPLWEQGLDPGFGSNLLTADLIALGGDVVVGGSTSDDVSDWVVTRLNGLTGAVIWQQRSPVEAGTDHLGALAAVGPDVMAVGQTVAPGISEFYAVARLNGATGLPLWTQMLPGNAPAGNLCHDVAVSATGTIVTCGQLGEATAPAFAQVEFDGAGAVLATRTISNFPDLGQTAALSVAVDPAGNTVAGGAVLVGPAEERTTQAYTDCAPPVIVDCSVNPTNLPPAGGLVTIQAEVTDNVAVETVQAFLETPGVPAIQITLNPLGGNMYAGQVVLPPNMSAVPVQWDVTVRAVDFATLQTLAPCGSVIVQGSVDNEPPQVVECMVDPTNLPFTGGFVSIQAIITDNVGVTQAVARVNEPGGTFTDIVLTPGPGNEFSGQYLAPPNMTALPQAYSVLLSASDAAGNQVQGVDCGGFTVQAGPDTDPPVIADCGVTPDVLGPAGGVVTIEATVTDNVAVQSVTARVDEPGGTFSTVTLSATGGDGYSGTYTAPPNGTALDQLYAVSLTARDTSGNQAGAPCGEFVVLPGSDQQPPVVVSCSLNPTLLPPSGGSVTVTATVTDDVAVQSVVARVAEPGGGSSLVPLNPIGSDQYSGVYQAAANPGPGARTYPVTIQARDTASNLTQADCGQFVVRDPSDPNPPSILRCDASPRLLPASGGAVTVDAEVTDDQSVAGVAARFVRNDGTVFDLPLALVSGNLYRGVFQAPANPNQAAQRYQAAVRAVDTGGNVATADCGVVDVQGTDSTLPEVLECRVEPRFLTRTGGDVVVTARVRDNLGVGAVTAEFRLPGSATLVAVLGRVGQPGGIETWQGVGTLPANTTGQRQTYSVDLVVRDTSANETRADCGPVIVGTGDRPGGGGRLRIEPRSVNFGVVPIRTRARKAVALRNVGPPGSVLTGVIEPLEAPFAVSVAQAPPGSVGSAAPISGPIRFRLLAGQTLVLAVGFRPPAVERFRDLLEVASDDAVRPNRQVPVRGAGCRPRRQQR